jgi:hypothetical protein
MHTKCWSDNLKEREHTEDLCIDGKIILEWILKNMKSGVSWINLFRSGDSWRAFVDTVMNLRVPLKVEYFLTSLATVSFQSRVLFHMM